jgi:hypothetical protein
MIFVLHSGGETTIYLVSSVFTSRPTLLLASNSFSVFLYGVYVFAQYSNIVSIDQEVMCSVQFQFFLLLLDLPDDFYSKAKLKISGDKAYPCFMPFAVRNVSDTFLLTRTLL